jgi:hypothetical protein
LEVGHSPSWEAPAAGSLLHGHSHLTPVSLFLFIRAVSGGRTSTKEILHTHFRAFDFCIA